MEQKNEIEKKLLEFCDENPEHEYEHVLLAVKKAFNLGIQMSADNAKCCKTGNSGSWFDASVDKESILKLKI